ncbi:MAG: hypothetical protein ACRDEA_17605 [Microcystaceae cyanobacterium]
MYWPLVGIGATLQQFMVAYREVFCREAGFEHVSRYINGLLLSANKTLQGINAQIVWTQGKQVSRRTGRRSATATLSKRRVGLSTDDSTG